MTFHEDMTDLMERIIRVAFQAGYNAAAKDREPNGYHMGCPDRYADWREHGPGALFPFGEAARPKPTPLRETAAFQNAMTALQELGGDELEVCTTHLVFVPCRHGLPSASECRRSSDARMVKIVRAYQNESIDLVHAQAAIQAYQPR